MLAGAAAGGVLVPGAKAITKKQAVKVALRALHPSRVRGRVVVFGLPKALPRGSRLSEAAPGARRGKPLKRPAWLFWADWAYNAQFEHPSTALLVDAKSGNVVRKRRMAMYPLVNGKAPAFLRSQAAYNSARYRVYRGFPRRGSRVARRAMLLSPTAIPAKRAALPTLRNDCLLVIGDHEDSLFDGDFGYVNAWASMVGLHVNDVATVGDLDSRIGALSNQEGAKPPCKDAMVVVIGHGWPEHPINDPNTGGPVPTSPVPQVEAGHKVVDGKKTGDYELVKATDLGTIFKKYETKVTFKLVVDACFSGRFKEWFGYPSIFPNIRVVATSSSAKEFSWGNISTWFPALPGSPGNRSFLSGVFKTSPNAFGSGEFTNGLFGALTQVSDSSADLRLTDGDLGKMLTRAFQLELKGDFAAQLGWTTPQIYVNPDAKVVAPPPPYTYHQLGTAGGNASAAYGVSAKAGVVGAAKTATGGTVIFKLAKPKPGITGGGVSLGKAAAFPNAEGVGINTSGQLAVTGYTSDFSAQHPFLWSNGVFTDLGTLGGESGFANGINDAGAVVGTADTKSGAFHPFLWQNGSMRDLGTLGGIVAGGNAVNDAGTATGYSSLPGNDVFHAFRWSNGNMLDLGTLPGFHDSFGAALNERGDVVGSAANGSAVRAFAFEGSSLLNLGTLPGLPNSTASGINDLGQIVGWSYDSSTQRPFLIADGAMRDLNSLVPAGTRATLVYAHAIDDLGDIAGTAAQNGELRGFLLQPSPGAQLANVVQLIDGWNATRAPVNRSGTGFFAKRAVLLFDGGSIPAGCRALTDLRTDAAQEQKRNYLAPSQISELTTLTDAVGESAGCP